MIKRQNKLLQIKQVQLLFLAIIGLIIVMGILIQGNNVQLFNSKGIIAAGERQLMFRAVLILLEIAVPALTVFYYTAWKYRESNDKATYTPEVLKDKTTVFAIWAIPSITMIILATMMWPAAHQLAPQKSLANGAQPLTIEVIALRWKWLFIYPQQNIASVNFVQIPTNTPVKFELTADEAPMSSFWIPQLSGQLYAMTGHINHLNIMAINTGDYRGSSAELNGSGFAGMKFTARAGTSKDFDQWVQSMKTGPKKLDSSEYQKLLQPSENNPVASYSTTDQALYDRVVAKYIGSHGQHVEHS